jgi:hypothetical protein
MLAAFATGAVLTTVGYLGHRKKVKTVKGKQPRNPRSTIQLLQTTVQTPIIKKLKLELTSYYNQRPFAPSQSATLNLVHTIRGVVTGFDSITRLMTSHNKAELAHDLLLMSTILNKRLSVPSVKRGEYG